MDHDCTERHQLDEACEPCEICELRAENARLNQQLEAESVAYYLLRDERDALTQRITEMEADYDKLFDDAVMRKNGNGTYEYTFRIKNVQADEFIAEFVHQFKKELIERLNLEFSRGLQGEGRTDVNPVGFLNLSNKETR